MSVKLMGAIFDLDIPAPEKLVLLAMADHARDDGTGCYASMSRLAKKTGLTKRGVQKIIRRLESPDVHMVMAGKITRFGTVEYTLILGDGGGEQGSLPLSGNAAKGVNEKTRSSECGSSELLRTKTVTGDRRGGGTQDTSSNVVTFPDTAAAFAILNLGEPFGHSAFKAAVVNRAPERQGENLLDVLERIAQDCDGKCPPRFFDRKHALERAEEQPVHLRDTQPALAERDPQRARELLRAIDESHRTGISADDLLREWAEQRKTQAATA